MFLQITLWWLFHTATVFWQIRFHFHAQKVKTARKIKYIHITLVLSGILLPLLPIITSMTDFAVNLKSDEVLKRHNVTFLSGGMGYGLPQFPPIICIATDRDSVFYSLAFPLIFLLAIGITIIIFLFRYIHKVSAKPIIPFISYALNSFIIYNHIIISLKKGLPSLALMIENPLPDSAIMNFFHLLLLAIWTPHSKEVQRSL